MCVCVCVHMYVYLYYDIMWWLQITCMMVANAKQTWNAVSLQLFQIKYTIYVKF